MAPPAPYLDALRMLARRELSEAQVRTRLVRRGHLPDAIDEAVERLKAERSLDDSRVAAAIARSETEFKRRGRLRVRQAIERAGIAAGIARRVADDTFAGLDTDALIAAVIEKRMRGRATMTDDREAQRLYRYLIGQGFEADRVRQALDRLRRAR
jgi:regulatory protein